MHIVLLNDKYGKPGASSAIVKTLAEGYKKHGHTITIVTTHRTNECPEIVHNDEVISIPVSYRLSLRHYKSLHSSRVEDMLKNIFESIRPDAVHAHNIHTYLTYDSLQVARKYVQSVVLTMHDVMSFAYGRLQTDRYLNSLGKDARLTWKNHMQKAGLQYNPFRNRYIRKSLRFTTNIVAVSAALQRALHQNKIEAESIIHHGIDQQREVHETEKVQFKNQYGLNDKKIILFGGRIGIDKGIIPLLRAFAIVKAKVPNVVLLLMGRETDVAKWISLANVPSSVYESIVQTGWLNAGGVQTANAITDIVTTPSLCLDTFNMMNLEAMAAAKPVVGTIFGGTPEVVQDGMTGYIVDPRNTDIYASKMINLLKDESLAKKMGEAGRMRATQNFSIEKQIESYLALLKNQ